MPLISVCIVVFNGRQYITEALASIASQTFRNFELIVVDGGSTDGTVEILKAHRSLITQLVSEPDEGIYDAMNKARHLASGDWLLFLGCDDALLDSLAKVSTLLNDRRKVYYGDVIIRATGCVFGGQFSKYRLMQVNICHQAIFYPKAIYKEHSYNLRYRFLADYEYNLRLIGQRIKFRYIPVTVSVFNLAGASMGGDPQFELDRLRLIRLNFGYVYAALKAFRSACIEAIRPFRRFSRKPL
jgi:glycosyltransferase involved in cell wall biosynthesis